MADYTVTAGHNGVEPWTMTASQVDTVTFADNVAKVEIISNGAAEVRVTNGGSTPVVGNNGASTIAYRLPAGSAGVLTMLMPKDVDVVKLVSSGTPIVSVQISRD